MNVYDYDSCNEFSRSAVKVLKEWLGQWYRNISDVQDVPAWQEQNVDLITLTNEDGRLKLLTFECKADTYYYSKNYFAERIANICENTMGCWFGTKSDYLLYYFPDTSQVHILPTKLTQQWSWRNLDFLVSCETATAGPKGKILYKTLGYLIPRDRIRQDVPIQVIEI